MNHDTDEPNAARDAVEDLQHEPFEKARHAVDVARAIFAGDAAIGEESPVAAAPQATREPSSDTVQNPAGE